MHWLQHCLTFLSKFYASNMRVCVVWSVFVAPNATVLCDCGIEGFDSAAR